MKLAQVFGKGVIKHLDNQRFKTFFKYILLSWIGLISFSVHTYPITPGLDWSWVFALNYFPAKGINCGKDLARTYGPIGFSEEGRLFVVEGWAIDAETKDIAGGVYIDIDGKFYQASYGGELRDGFIGGIANDPMVGPIYKNSTYIGVIPISGIGQGPHTLSIKILTKGKMAYYNTEKKILFEIR